MGKKKQPDSHFQRGHGQLGWVYVARNNMHQDDVYKVGYTEKTPEERVSRLNTEQRNRTSQIGFFSLVYACAVLDAQGCEEALFTRLGRLLESSRKEFVNAPLEVIIGELLHIQKSDNAKVRSTRFCIHCKDTMDFCPLPQATLACQTCGALFRCTADGDVDYKAKSTHLKKSYKPATDFSIKRQHSPLAQAYIRLQSAVKNYAHEGIWTDDEFLEEIEDLLQVTVLPDRETSEARPVAKPKPRSPRATKTPESRKGWMDCPDCLSSIKISPPDKNECLECGWIEK